MKNSLTLLAALFLSSHFTFAQGTVPSGGASARDGFTRRGTTVIFTRNGVSQVVEKEMSLDNGIRVLADGSVMMPSGEKSSLRNNQILTLQGTFEDVALSPQGTAPMTSVSNPTTKVGEEVGVSSTDGISVSAGSTLVTRNGVTQRLLEEIKLANGTRVQPNGTVTTPDGKQIIMRANQTLTFEGLLLETPERSTPAAPAARDGGVLPPSSPSTTSPQ